LGTTDSDRDGSDRNPEFQSPRCRADLFVEEVRRWQSGRRGTYLAHSEDSGGRTLQRGRREYMRREHRRLATLVVAFAVLSPLISGEMWAKKEVVTVAGVVKKADVRGGEVKGVYIADPEKGDFVVTRGMDKSKEFLTLVGKTVKATGYVKKALRDADFEYAIDVVEYEIVPTSEADVQTEPQPATDGAN
jgi:hypothetical protein